MRAHAEALSPESVADGAGEDGHGRCRRHARSTPSALLRWAGPPPGVSADLPESVLATASTQTDQSELLQVTALASSVEEVREALEAARSHMCHVEGKVRLEHARWTDQEELATERRLRERVGVVASAYEQAVEKQRGAYATSVANLAIASAKEQARMAEEAVEREALRWQKVVGDLRSELARAQVEVGRLRTEADTLRDAERYAQEKLSMLYDEPQSSADDAQRIKQLEALTNTLRDELRSRNEELTHESTRSATLSENAQSIGEVHRRERQDAAKCAEDLTRELEAAREAHVRERDSLKMELEGYRQRLEGAQADNRRERMVGSVVQARQKAAIDRLEGETAKLKEQVKALQQRVDHAPGRMGTAMLRGPRDSSERSGLDGATITERVRAALANVEEEEAVMRAMSGNTARACGNGGRSRRRRGLAAPQAGADAVAAGVAKGAPSFAAIAKRVSDTRSVLGRIQATQRALSIAYKGAPR